MIRVLLADDPGLMRDGLRVLVNTQPDLHVVAEAEDVWNVWRFANEVQVDVAVVDLALTGGGLVAIQKLALVPHPPRVVVLVADGDEIGGREAMASGAAACVAKAARSETLIRAIRGVASGDSFAAVAKLEGNDGAPRSGLALLSSREREVLRLIAGGHTNQKAAERMGVSVKTVEGYRSRVMRKLDACGRVDLVRIALGSGLLDSSD